MSSSKTTGAGSPGQRPAPRRKSIQGQRGNDAASIICANLIAEQGVRRSRLAYSLGLPGLVIEESIRSGESSRVLRGQLLLWLQDNAAIAVKLPPGLVQRLQDTCEADVEMRQDVSSQQEEYPMSALDPLSRNHFVQLQSIVGQNFISILNDPTEVSLETTNNLTNWLGGKIYEAFDYGGSNTATRSVEELLEAYRMAVRLKPESSTMLLTEYPPQTNFSSYVDLVSSAYQVNKKESRRDFSYLHSLGIQPDDLPWPEDVPADYFVKGYDVRREVELLPPLPEGHAGTPVERTPDASVSAGGKPHTEKVLTSTTFTKDFVVLEQRQKTLRLWESSVEKCLLKHVQSRSEDFFVTSRRFDELQQEAVCALEDATTTRTSRLTKSQRNITDHIRIGSLHRRRTNFDTVHNMVDRVRGAFRLISSIENWIALPEREMTELSQFVDNMLSLEAFVQGDATSSGVLAGVTYTELKNLNCMKEFPSRVDKARSCMESMLRHEVLAALSELQGSPASPTAAARSPPTALADGAAIELCCRAAAHLKLLPGILASHRDACCHSLWTLVKERVTAFLVSSSALDNAKADALLSLTTSAKASVREKARLLEFANDCSFDIYYQLFSHLLHYMEEYVSRAALSWGHFVRQALRPTLALDEAGPAQIRDVTLDLFSCVCRDAEELIEALITTRAAGRPLSSTEEIQRVSLLTARAVAQLQDPLLRLEQELAAERVGPWVSAVEVGRPRRAVKNLAKSYFQIHHTRQMEKLQLFMENEIWSVKEDVDTMFQLHLQTLCASDEKAVTEFMLLSAEMESGSPSVVLSRRKSRRLRQPQGEDDVLQKTNKLYTSLEGDSVGRVVNDSVLVLIELLQTYDAFLGQFPALATDLVTKTFEILSSYDALCAKLVLGAEAVRRGPLRTITITHLAVASQCLGLLSDFVPLYQRRLVAVLHLEEAPAETEAARRDSVAAKRARLASLIDAQLL
ncbi:hypothetical protein STCU_09066, partial [Strigomonas culicis]